MIKKITFHSLVIFTVLFALASCSCDNHRSPVIIPDKSKPVDVGPPIRNVDDAKTLNKEAQTRLKIIKEEIKKATDESKKAEVVVVEMKKKQSPFADTVNGIKANCDLIIDIVTFQVNKTGDVLDQQLVKLTIAAEELAKAREASLASEKEKTELRSSIAKASEKLIKSEKEVKELQEWKDKNMWYKKFFWWVTISVSVLVIAWVYFSGATGGLSRVLRG